MSGPNRKWYSDDLTREKQVDPTQCLVQAYREMTDSDLPAALSRLIDYAQWRGDGGFEPKSVTLLTPSPVTLDGDIWFNRIKNAVVENVLLKLVWPL